MEAGDDSSKSMLDLLALEAENALARDSQAQQQQVL